MDAQYASRNEELEHRWDRVFRWALVASVLFHVVVLLMFRQQQMLPESPLAAAGERAGDPRAAAGGGMEMVNIQVATPPVPEEVVEPVPVPEPEPQPEPEVKPQEPLQSSQTPGQQASAGEGRGQEAGPGTETGTGRGDGGTSDEGLYRVTAPSPRGMILPPSDRPSRVRGKTITVYVFVADNGSVVSDSTRINPSSGDARFDRRLRDDASQWKFRPGMRGGTPIAAWFPYVLTF
jgi:outer membrane biosynthesis protein TonB